MILYVLLALVLLSFLFVLPPTLVIYLLPLFLPCRSIARTLQWTRLSVLRQVSRQDRRSAWRFVSSLISWGRWEASSACPQELAANTSFHYTGSASLPKLRAHSASGLVAMSRSPSRTCSCRPQLSLFRYRADDLRLRKITRSKKGTKDVIFLKGLKGNWEWECVLHLYLHI